MVGTPAINCGLRTPMSKTTPKLRETAIQRSHLKRMQTHSVSSGSPVLAPSQTLVSQQRSPVPASAGKATEEQRMASSEAGGQENIKDVTSSRIPRGQLEHCGEGVGYSLIYGAVTVLSLRDWWVVCVENHHVFPQAIIELSVPQLEVPLH